MPPGDEPTLKTVGPALERYREKILAKALVDGATGCWLWTGKRTQGYGIVSNGRGGKEARAHRVAYAVFVGPIPAGLCVLHRCDNPQCCNPDHLFLGTRADNLADMYSKNRGRPFGGTILRGEKHGRARLTESDIREIRRRLNTDEPRVSIMRAFGISKTMLRHIRIGVAWSCVTDEHPSNQLPTDSL